jgi:hypothetical protein
MHVTFAVLTVPPPHIDERPETVATPRQLIPGAYERNTLTHRQPGSMGGPAFGSTGIPAGPSSMDRATTMEREKEGGRVGNGRARGAAQK